MGLPIAKHNAHVFEYAFFGRGKPTGHEVLREGDRVGAEFKLDQRCKIQKPDAVNPSYILWLVGSLNNDRAPLAPESYLDISVEGVQEDDRVLSGGQLDALLGSSPGTPFADRVLIPLGEVTDQIAGDDDFQRFDDRMIASFARSGSDTLSSTLKTPVSAPSNRMTVTADSLRARRDKTRFGDIADQLNYDLDELAAHMNQTGTSPEELLAQFDAV